MKKSVLYALTFSLLGSLLLAISFTNSWASLLCFIALVPLLIATKKAGSFLSSILITVAGAALSVFVLNLTTADISFEGSIGQFLMFALPWIFYQHIRQNHNEKLGYLALVSSWVFLEWQASQYFGKWHGLQLGHSLTTVPFLINWYGFLGVSAGSVWILVINIQISRALMPAEAHTRKHALINGSFVILAPVLVSVFWYGGEKTGNFSAVIIEMEGQTQLLSENKNVLSANNLKIDQLVYNSVFDTVTNAFVKDKSGQTTWVLTKKLRIGSIGGIRNQHLTIADFEKNKIGLLNSYSMLRADLVRLYALEKCNLLLCYDDSEGISPQILRSRALENNIDIIQLKKDRSILFLKSGKEHQKVKTLSIESKKSSFFTLYGDLTGRLSIFVSLWMLLGSIVKPYRKK